MTSDQDSMTDILFRHIYRHFYPTFYYDIIPVFTATLLYDIVHDIMTDIWFDILSDISSEPQPSVRLKGRRAAVLCIVREFYEKGIYDIRTVLLYAADSTERDISETISFKKGRNRIKLVGYDCKNVSIDGEIGKK